MNVVEHKFWPLGPALAVEGEATASVRDWSAEWLCHTTTADGPSVTIDVTRGKVVGNPGLWQGPWRLGDDRIWRRVRWLGRYDIEFQVALP